MENESEKSAPETPESTAPDSEPVSNSDQEAVHQEFRRVDTNQTQTTGLYGSQNSGGPGKVLLLILGLIVLLAIGATGYLLRDKFTKSEPTPTPTATLETPVSEETPTPTPSFDRSKYTLRVLNGTKTSGLAGSVSAQLKELGYNIGKTGNATSSAIGQTTIRIKGEPEGLLETLIKDLSDDFDAISGKALDEDDEMDAEVILGAT